ncbi:hypothetical protein NQ317_001336 [Molorchus minor]|uniref:Uncharacterized protein n=1 Tax=Molorchus minor TaxID=1323400 RepID=A0ABQ9JU13_9CUCU|nr:hypothetical protein NQ317_001336 [Molorchus minor]
MRDLTQVGFPMVEDGPFGTRRVHLQTKPLGCTSIEEYIFSCPPIRTLKCFSINIIRLWNGQTCIRAFKIRRRAGRTWKRLIAAIT